MGSKEQAVLIVDGIGSLPCLAALLDLLRRQGLGFRVVRGGFPFRPREAKLAKPAASKALGFMLASRHNVTILKGLSQRGKPHLKCMINFISWGFRGLR